MEVSSKQELEESTRSEEEELDREFKEQLVNLLKLPWVFILLLLKLLVDFIGNPLQFFNRQSSKQYSAPEIPSGLHSKFVQVNGINLHTVQGGDENAPLMIFLHGFPEFWYSWRHQLREFQKHYFVVAVDMRGYNLSDKPQGVDSYSIELLASDIAEMVLSLGYKNCILAGHDWGGVVAQFAAVSYPQIVSKLIVVATVNAQLAAYNRTKEDAQRFWYVSLFRIPVLSEMLLSKKNFKIIRNMFLPQTKGGPVYPHANSVEEAEWYVQACAQPRALTSMLNYYRKYVSQYFQLGLSRRKNKQIQEFKKIYDQISQPTLIILGEDDFVIKQHQWDGYQRQLQNANLEVIRHCSHWVPFDRPDEVNKLITEFLKEN